MEKDLIIVYSSDQDYQIQIAKELLDENDIESFTLNQHDSVIPTIGLIELYVNIKDQQAAEKILKKLKR
ncbi:putative signal transducing protein [Sunxiuqinia sp. sy24]|uniref:putative signal transducing protein n=1 Tax=Sunxiuqinia sp. sy24 TaxID=3461495 RepID=UPI004045CE38